MSERIPEWKKGLQPIEGHDAEAAWYRFLAEHPELYLETEEPLTGDELVVVLDEQFEIPMSVGATVAAELIDSWGHWADHACIPALNLLMSQLVEPLVDAMHERLYPTVPEEGE